MLLGHIGGIQSGLSTLMSAFLYIKVQRSPSHCCDNKSLHIIMLRSFTIVTIISSFVGWICRCEFVKWFLWFPLVLYLLTFNLFKVLIFSLRPVDELVRCNTMLGLWRQQSRKQKAASSHCFPQRLFVRWRQGNGTMHEPLCVPFCVSMREQWPEQEPYGGNSFQTQHPHSFTYYPKLVTIGECGNINRLVNWELPPPTPTPTSCLELILVSHNSTLISWRRVALQVSALILFSFLFWPPFVLCLLARAALELHVIREAEAWVMKQDW